MPDRTTQDSILIQLDVLRRLLPEHVLLTYIDTPQRNENINSAFMAQFNPGGKRTKQQTLDAYSEKVAEAIVSINAVIVDKTREAEVDALLCHIMATHSS
jgi:hypothetical protein